MQRAAPGRAPNGRSAVPLVARRIARRVVVIVDAPGPGVDAVGVLVPTIDSLARVSSIDR